jgi:hypothetical protein
MYLPQEYRRMSLYEALGKGGIIQAAELPSSSINNLSLDFQGRALRCHIADGSAFSVLAPRLVEEIKEF